MSSSSSSLSLSEAFAQILSLESFQGARAAMAKSMASFFQALIRSNRTDDITAFIRLFDSSTDLGIGDALLIKALSKYSRQDPESVKAQVKATGDAGTWIQAQTCANPSISVSLIDFCHRLDAIALIQGKGAQENKVNATIDLLQCGQGITNGLLLVVRIVQGKLRVGMTLKTIVQSAVSALCSCLAPDKKQQDRLGKLILEHPQATIHSNLLAQVLSCTTIDSVQSLLSSSSISPGTFVSPMLAKPSTSFEAVVSTDGQPSLCQYKYDGERAQVHWNASTRTFTVFSRNGQDSTEKYSIVRDSFIQSLVDPSAHCIIDAEMVATDSEGRILPFQHITTLAKKGGHSSPVNVTLIAFDILLYGTTFLSDRRLDERVTCLEHAIRRIPNQVDFAQGAIVSDSTEACALLDEAVQAGCEGLMVKRLDSFYEPAKRSSAWLKLKKDYIDGLGDTLDVVPIGAWVGKGKRHGRFGTYLVAAYNVDCGRYQALAKVGSGFSDDSLNHLWHQFHSMAIVRQDKPSSIDCQGPRPDVWFEPSCVWEVRAADFTESPVYDCAKGLLGPQGVSLRFPRFVRERPDKRPIDATTHRQILQMYLEQPAVKSAK